MSNFAKGCSCNGCKAGKHSKYSKIATKKAIKSFKRKNKTQSLLIDEKVDYVISLPYTD